MKKKIVVIGSGYWGKNLVRNFYDLSALYGICDTNQEILQQFSQQYPGIKTFKNTLDFLEDNEVQGVVIAAPAHVHFQIAKQCLLANKDVYVEKPLCLDIEEAKVLIELASQRQRILMVGHILHYHPAVIKLKELISSSKYGTIQYIYSNRLSWGKFRSEEDVLWSFAPHDISMILGLVQSLVSKVTNQSSDFVQKDNADVSMSYLEFENGVKGHIFVSWAHPFKEQRLVVICDKGTLVFDDTKPWNEKLSIYHNQVEFGKGDPVAMKGEVEYIYLEEGEPLKEECRHFLKCMETRETPITDGEEGLAVLRVLEELTKKKVMDKNQKFWVHETAIVDDGAQIGSGTKVWHFSHVLGDAKIGENCSIGQNVVVMNRVELGNNVKVQNNVSLYEGVIAEDDTFLGPSMVFTNVVNPRSAVSRKHEYKETLVKKGASIGANATIVCGNTLGQYSFVGAGSVVTKDVPDFALVYGNPAKLRGWMCECGVALDSNLDLDVEELTCEDCGKKYKRSNDQVRQIN